jgi:hypothetical protein
MDQEQILEFKFTVAEANAILAVLGDAPYGRVAAIVTSFQMQAAPQIVAAPAPAEEVAEEVTE